MKPQAITEKFTEANVTALVVPVFKEDKASGVPFSALDKIAGGTVAAVFKSGEMKGKQGDVALIHITPKRGVKATKILLVGVGAKADFKAPQAAVAAGTAARFLRKKSTTSFAMLARTKADAEEIAAGAAQGVVCSQFELDKYRTSDRSPKAISKFVFCVEGADIAEVRAGLEKGVCIGESMNFARELANEPPNVLHPTEMAARAKAMAKELGLKCEILDEAQMEKLGMGSLLSVSKGSEQPAKLIVLRYEPAEKASKGEGLLALVGKGITFDTGGISLKPGEGMDAMKYDMSGGATVLGTMRAVALLKPSVPVLGVVAAVENMPDGKATRPSDVVTAMNGKTIEILNTDAEGRLILADAVAYAESQGATRIVDMATLTGAVIIALGDVNTAVLGNDQDLVDDIVACGKEAGEGFWQLPVGADYSRMIKSDIADMKNIGPARKAGTIVGAVFIQEFVSKAKWAHLDIAGTAWCDNERPHMAKGPTAVAVRTLLKLVERS